MFVTINIFKLFFDLLQSSANVRTPCQSKAECRWWHWQRSRRTSGLNSELNWKMLSVCSAGRLMQVPRKNSSKIWTSTRWKGCATMRRWIGRVRRSELNRQTLHSESRLFWKCFIQLYNAIVISGTSWGKCSIGKVSQKGVSNKSFYRTLDQMRRELALLKEMVVVCAAKGDATGGTDDKQKQGHRWKNGNKYQQIFIFKH